MTEPSQEAAKPRREPRAWEQLTREAAFAAARLVMDGATGSLTEAANKTGATRQMTGRAFTLLKYGKPEDIAAVEVGQASLVKACKALRETSPEARAHKNPIKGHEHQDKITADARLWKRLRDALDEINSLPQPSDLVAIVKRNSRRVETLNQKLINAYGWITEFSDAWTK